MRFTWNKGFTLVEMLLVVSLLGIITVLTLTVINAEAQKKRAKDAVLRSRLEQYIQSIESYGADGGFFPISSNGAPSGSSLDELLVSWDSAAGFKYVVNGAKTNFAVYVPVSNGSYYKYAYSWDKIKNCKPESISVVTYCAETVQ